MDLKAALKTGKEQPKPPKKESFIKLKDTTETVSRKPLDLDAAKVAFGRFNQKIEELERNSKAITIRTEEDYQGASGLFIQVNKLLKSVEDMRKMIIKEEDKFVRDVNGLARFMKGKIEPTKGELSRKIGQGRAFLDAEAEKKRREAEEELKKTQEELNKKYEGTGKEAPQIQEQLPVQSQAEKTVRTEHGSLHTRHEIKCIIVDPAKVPREYCEPVQKLLNEAVKRGIREIPGCEIKSVHTPISR